MPDQITRRETLRRGLAATSLLGLLADGVLPALAQGETDVPFTDLPANFNPSANLNGATRQYDIRKIDGMLTPKEQFFTTQHFMKPEVDGATYKLKFTGLVKKPAEFSLADLKAMKSVELVNGFECSGNSARGVQGLASCAR
ncbi:MAG TPA: molybdopterin-dependent oxidoreductase, partial [Bryobacteraceae bacterium]